MDYPVEHGRNLRPRGTRVLYEYDRSDVESSGESSAAGARSGDEGGYGGTSRRRASPFHDTEEEASEDEWRPDSSKTVQKRRRRSHGGRHANESDRGSDDSESSLGEDNEDLEDDGMIAVNRKKAGLAPSAKKRKKSALVERGSNLSAGAAAAERHKAAQRKRPHKPGRQRTDHHTNLVTQSPRDIPAEPTTITELLPPSPEEDGVDAQAEADRLWRDVRARKDGNASRQPADVNSHAAKSSTPAAAVNKPAGALDGWLGKEPPPWPTTCADAMINDRDSLFVGFVYSLDSSSQSEMTRCISHLTKVVQPQAVPQSRLPPAMQHLAPTRRGATHDMYAWRCLALKRGRTGLGGPEDFGLEEGSEDDGERFGSKEIAKVIRMYGATDVLVIVSRWYGGTMLGPVRFRHIEECAKAALSQHMVNEAMAELLSDLRQLDRDIAEIRTQRGQTSLSAKPALTYTDLDPERAQRLVSARKKQLEILKSAKAANAGMDSIHTQGHGAHPNENEQELEGSQFNEAEEEAAYEAMAAAEAATISASDAIDERTAGHQSAEGAQAASQPGGIEVKAEPQSDMEEPAEQPLLRIKPDPDAPRERSPSPIPAPNSNDVTESGHLPRVKQEQSSRNVLSPPAHASATLEPRVKLEQPDEDTDLTGWDELS